VWQAGHPVAQALRVQQTLGKRAAKRLLRLRAIQARLTISQLGDQYEQEADRVAEEVIMRISKPNDQVESASCL
jgi:hypothetical protein